VAIGDGGDSVEEFGPDPGTGVDPQHVERNEHRGKYNGEVSPRRHALVLELERSGILPHEQGLLPARRLPLRDNTLLRLDASPDRPGGTSVGENAWDWESGERRSDWV